MKTDLSKKFIIVLWSSSFQETTQKLLRKTLFNYHDLKAHGELTTRF